ncbi:MAG: hypothetical protein EOM03_15425, partial [Clostridia bacterium]|nr:hypothetical protein [Clostridia bacterium]
FNVTLDPAGGESAEQSLTVTYDSTYGAMPTPTRTGYTFAGWFTAATGGSEVLATEIVSITADQTLYAQWTAKTYTITFDSNGGTTLAVNQKTVTYGSVYGDMPVPEKTGYTCSGWFTAKSGGIPISSTDTVAMTADQTLYAQWSANSYWVSFNGNGATSGTMISQSLRYDAATKLKANSYIRLGYEFAGWAKTDSGSVVYADQASVSNLTAAANATVNLYAQWRQVSYSLQFNSAGGSAVSPQTGLHYGDSISAPTTTRTGYDFIGWFTDSTLLNKMTWTTMPAENLTLTAGWKLIDYSVTYVLYGGINHTSNPDIYTVTSQEITLGAPTRTGYTFGGWYLDAAFTKPVAGAAIPAGSTGNRTFYAQWTPVSYSIDYRDLNGMTHNNPTSYTIENSFDLKDPSVRTGYDFGGWYETYNYSGTPVTQIVAGSTGNKTYYAKWNIKSYTVTYSMDLGTNSADNPSAYTIESAAITLADPSRTGYAFAGWHTDEMLASKVSDVAIPTGSTGNRIFYAKWTPLEYEIQYNLDGGTNSSSNLSTYTIETSDLVLQAPSRQGYTFGGWHRSSDFSGSPVLSIPKGSTGSVTLYAKWSKDIYQINYALDGATNASANPATYTVDSATITLQSPTKGVDDIFLGWYANSSFTGAIVTEIPTGSTGDLYLYAKIVNYGKFSVANTSGSTFTISRTGGTYGPQIVTYRTQNGSAIRGTHFTAVSGSVTFAAGEITKTVTVTELGVTSQFSTYVATSYTNADRTYFFDLVNVAGGGKLDSTNRATRIMTRNSNYEVNAAYLNDYKQIASKTADLQVKEAPDGYGYNATISAGLSSSVLPSSVYSSYLQTYIKATASKMKIQLKNFSGKDGNTLDVNDWGWRMWRYVLFNNHEQGVSFSGDKTGAIPNLPDGTKHVLVYGITDNVDNRDNYSVNLPGPTGALSASGTTHAVSIAYTMRAADQDSNSYVLYNFADTCGISVGGYNSAGANSSWRYSGGSLYASPKDTTEPKLIGVAPMASNSYSFGDKVVVSLVFDEIVNSASSVSISTLYSN